MAMEFVGQEVHQESPMGCGGSKTKPALSAFDQRVSESLRKFKEQYDKVKKGHINSFDQVILKFPKIHNAFQEVKKLFNSCDDDGNGTLDYGEIKPIMEKLGTQTMTDEEISTVFNEADMYQNNQLTHKEFMVCLALGYVLGDIKVENSEGLGGEVKQAFDDVLGAYFIFDVDGGGTLDKEEVMRQMQSKEGAFKSASAASVLTKERWAEMDWDHDGNISFKEFFWAFQKWIGSEDGTDED